VLAAGAACETWAEADAERHADVRTSGRTTYLQANAMRCEMLASRADDGPGRAAD
jgi:hypothetical protein